MSFKNISDLLIKYSNFLPQDRIIKDAIICVSSNFGIDLKKEEIEIKHGVVYLKTDFTTKSKIFVNKTNIMIELKKILTKKTPKDIV